jgi:hypothetical protein
MLVPAFWQTLQLEEGEKIFNCSKKCCLSEKTNKTSLCKKRIKLYCILFIGVEIKCYPEFAVLFYGREVVGLFISMSRSHIKRSFINSTPCQILLGPD